MELLVVAFVILCVAVWVLFAWAFRTVEEADQLKIDLICDLVEQDKFVEAKRTLFSCHNMNAIIDDLQERLGVVKISKILTAPDIEQQ